MGQPGFSPRVPSVGTHPSSCVLPARVTGFGRLGPWAVSLRAVASSATAGAAALIRRCRGTGSKTSEVLAHLLAAAWEGRTCDSARGCGRAEGLEEGGRFCSWTSGCFMEQRSRMPGLERVWMKVLGRAVLAILPSGSCRPCPGF